MSSSVTDYSTDDQASQNLPGDVTYDWDGRYSDGMSVQSVKPPAKIATFQDGLGGLDFMESSAHDLALFGQICSLWPNIVGDLLAGRCTPSGLSNGTLSLTVAKPTWKTEIQRFIPEIVRKINLTVTGRPVESIELLERETHKAH